MEGGAVLGWAGVLLRQSVVWRLLAVRSTAFLCPPACHTAWRHACPAPCRLLSPLPPQPACPSLPLPPVLVCSCAQLTPLPACPLPCLPPHAAAPGPDPGKLAKRRHQISSLYHYAKQKELEQLEVRGTGVKTKAETHRKYGW